MINILCDNALLTGYAADQKVVDKNVIKEAAKDLHLEANWFQPRYWYSIGWHCGYHFITIRSLQNRLVI